MGPLFGKAWPFHRLSRAPKTVSSSSPFVSKTRGNGSDHFKPIEKKSNRKGPYPGIPGLLQSPISCTQERQLLETGDRSISSQPIHSEGTFQDGNHSFSQIIHQGRGLGSLSRSIGCVFPHSDPSPLPEVPSLHGRTYCFPVPCFTLWPFFGATGLHSSDARLSRPLPVTGYSSDSIPGRLVDSQLFPGSSSQRSGTGYQDSSSSWPSYQPGEIGFPPFQGFHLYRDPFSLQGQPNIRTGRPHLFHPESSIIGLQSPITPSKARSIITGSSQLSSGPGSVRTSSFTSSPNATSSTMETLHLPTIGVDSSLSDVPRSPPLVALGGQVSRSSSPPSAAVLISIHGRQSGGLGCPSRTSRSSGIGHMGGERTFQSHKLVGTGGSFSGSETLFIPSGGKSCSSFDRQYHGSVLYSQARGNSFPSLVSSCVAGPALVSGLSNSSLGQTPPRSSQCHSGSPLQVISPITSGVDSFSRDPLTTISSVGQTTSGPIRNPVECSSAALCVSSSGSTSLGHRRTFSRLDKTVSIRFPPVQSNSTGTSESAFISRVLSDFDSAQLATKIVVSKPSRSSSGPPGPITATSEHAHSRSKQSSSSKPRNTPSSRMEVVRRGVRKAKFSDKVASIVSRARRRSTRKVYDAKWIIFRDWCNRRSVDPTKPSMANVADFLLFLFKEKNLAISTIKGYRAMLSNTLKFGSHASSLGSDPVISELIRSFELERPVSRSLTPKWNLSVVLHSLISPPFEPLSEASIKFLSWKTVFLLTLASGARRSEIHALSMEPQLLRFNNNGSVSLSLQPGFLAKTQLPSVVPSPIVIPSLTAYCGNDDPDRLLCPVRALRQYLKMTSLSRGARTRLFIPLRGTKDISAASISRWIAETIKHAYSSISLSDRELLQVRPHELRALSASWAFVNHAPLEDILQAASWKSHSTFSSFYLRSLSQFSDDLYSLGPLVASQRVISA